MKVSVSLSDDVITYLDQRVRDHLDESRSAGVARAVRALQASELVDEYAEAFREWEESGEAAIWDSTVADGLEE